VINQPDDLSEDKSFTLLCVSGVVNPTLWEQNVTKRTMISDIAIFVGTFCSNNVGFTRPLFGI